MMDDRELLELAAKAAGLSVLTWNSRIPIAWNPLTDDGDALRLAVKLNILDNRSFLDALSEENESAWDYYTATRRAIVRAAAEIGRQL